MSKVWSQLARSKSIAANFNAKWVISQHQIFWYITDKYASIRDWQTHLVVPLSTFADQDVLKVISDNQEKESSARKVLEAKRTAHAAEAEAAKANAVKTESAAEGDGEETADEPAASEDGDEVEDDEEDDEDEGEGSGADPGAGGDPDPEAGDVDANKEEAGPIHIGVFCDGCKVSVPTNTRRLVINECLFQTGDPIVGNRFKCSVCENYDLCDSCHQAGIHDEHKMLKIEDPADAPEIQSLVRSIRLVIDVSPLIFLLCS
jgi:hypothetical protein